MGNNFELFNQRIKKNLKENDEPIKFSYSLVCSSVY